MQLPNGQQEQIPHIMPNNFEMATGQQQQQFAQQQHLQAQRTQQSAGVNDTEDQQMWQKILQQHQLRLYGEGRAQQGMDQMADFLRSQYFAQQVQGQQQYPRGRGQYPGVGVDAENHNNPNLFPQQSAMQPVRTQPPMQPLNDQQGQLPFQQNIFQPALPDGIRSSPLLASQVPPTTTPAGDPQNFAHMQLQMQQALQQFMKADDGSERWLTTPEILLKAKAFEQDIEAKEQHLQLMFANQAKSSPAYRQLAQDIVRRRALLLRLQDLFSRGATGMQQGGPQQPPRPNDGSDLRLSPLKVITDLQGGPQGMHNPNGAMGNPRPVSQLGRLQDQRPSNDPGQRQVYSRPSEEQLFASQRYIQAMKAELNANRTLQQLQPKHLPDHELDEFNKMLELLWRGAEKFDQWLSLYHAVFQDQMHTQRLIQIIITAKRQTQLLSSGQPNYVLDLPTVKRLFGMVQAAWEEFVSAVRTFPETRGNNMPGGPLGPPGPGPLPPTGPSQPPQQTIQQSAPQHPLTPHPQSQRQREEEPPAPTAVAPVTDPAPSPKRIKSEWSTDPKDAYVKDKEAENIQTDEQAAAFYEQMTELVRLANGPEGGSSLPPAISETLEMIVKSMGTGYDFSDNNIASSSSLTSDAINPGLKSPNLKAENEEFNQFFDFASFLHDDDAPSVGHPTTQQFTVQQTTPSEVDIGHDLQSRLSALNL